jgi:hypothetical protein
MGNIDFAVRKECGGTVQVIPFGQSTRQIIRKEYENRIFFVSVNLALSKQHSQTDKNSKTGNYICLVWQKRAPIHPGMPLGID